MSLNGLDDAKVIEAHESAITEPGGWFLLKYANRDEVELLDRGNGGIVDIRGAIAKYEEASPLYGFLKYRRRSVLLKYQPEDCSRLIQARAAVHFNAVCERFAPYDVTFEISVAKDLKDSKLSAACSLHTASGSASSSSSSLRRRRLNEIAEEEEEEERERKRQSTVKEEDKRASSVYSVPAHSPPIERPAVLDSQQISAPQETNFASTVNVPEFTGADRPTSPTQSESAPRLSSQSTRPDLYSYATYTYGKPKVKLGPRPSLETNKRPSTAENFRPTAALPAGFKLFSKGTKKGQSHDIHDMEQVEKTEEAEVEGVNLDTAPTPSTPIPEVPQGTGLQLPPRPATSSGASIKSTTQSLAPPPTKEVKITPEKARLMKAMKLREKKMMNTTTSEQTTPSDNPSIDEKKEECDTESKDSLQIKSEDAGHRAVSNADSGIAIDPPTPMTINTEDTSDSRPNSPTGATSSEIGVSTKASSLSESTDETVQASKDIRKESEEAEPKLLPGMEDGLEQAKTRDTDVLDKGDTKVDQESQKIPDHPTQTTEDSSHDSDEVDDRADIVSPPDSKGNEQPPTEDNTPKSPWRVPVSKFSSPEAKSPAEQKSPTTPRLKSKFSIPDISLPAEPVPALPNASVEGGEQTGGESLLKATSEIALPPRSAKRRTVIGTIRTDLTKTTGHSEASDPLLDDALMDELQSATLQEAKPMLVSKSPITPVFPNSNPVKQGPPLSRAVSNPMRGPLPVPGDVSQSSARSVSAGGAALLHSITRQSSNAGLQAKKNGLGSSISQRIKALEKLSGPPGSEEVRPKTAAPSSAFFSIRRQSIRETSRASTVVDPTSPQSQSPTPEQSQERPPKLTGAERRERSLSVASRLSMFEMPTQSSLRGRPDSVQVTARIVRDPGQSMPMKPEANASANDYPQLELKQSPLVVDLQTQESSEPIPEPVPTPLVQVHKETIQERRDNKKSDSEEGEKKHRRSSLSIVKDFIKDRRTSTANKSSDNLAVMSPNGAKSPNRPPSSHQNSGGFARRLSISSRRSSFSRERENSTSTSIGSPAVLSDSGSGDDDKKSEKKSETRASRFMRRLSNSLSGNNKKATSPHISPTVAEEDADQLAASTTDVSQSSQPAVVAYMGDVNVQFPDNLLWKRRSMSLDTQGFLFLSAVQGAAISGKDKAAAAGVKRYHLSDFRAPYIPDVEIQELPNSVVLDLVEGSCLQIACEDRAGQLNILNTLQDAHQKHSSFRQ
ncbi:hypothetical protein K445DRAFT_52168 [Daldinia sp. EC12]|nr:hypothetical protein K445DRAFT_52168 [Daldinia sp. EC12]